MAVMITDDCISCNACEAECPNTAIYSAGEDWSIGERLRERVVSGPRWHERLDESVDPLDDGRLALPHRLVRYDQFDAHNLPGHVAIQN